MNAKWLTEATRKQLEGCRIIAHDGTALYTPDGSAHYKALWTRDFAYMVQGAGDLIPPDEIRAAIFYLLNGQREDGTIPDRVQADGLAVYSAGAVGDPLGAPPTDNAQFMVILVHEYVTRTGDERLGRILVGPLILAMEGVERKAGLVHIPQGRRQSPYGFTDTIAKTGGLLFSSLLDWDANRRLIELEEMAHAPTADFAARMSEIESGLDALWDDEIGAFLAATGDCRQIDVWGNAFAISIGCLRGERRDRVLAFLRDRYDDYALRGQIRHLLRGEYWESLLKDVPPETYQNGAYWATASGWVMDALAQSDPELARRTRDDLFADFQSGGIWECVNTGGYRKVEHYVVSATNARAAILKLER